MAYSPTNEASSRMRSKRTAKEWVESAPKELHPEYAAALYGVSKDLSLPKSIREGADNALKRAADHLRKQHSEQ